MKSVDLIIKNANEVVTLNGPNRPRKMKEMNELSIIEHGSVAIDKGIIVASG